MDMVFIKVLNMSISASWVVLAVLALRVLLKKSPRWIHVCLWALVAVRLVCPFSIESVFSLIPSTQTVPEEIVYMEPPMDAQNTTLEIVQPRPGMDTVDVELDTTVSVAQTRQIRWTLLWPAGMAAMLLYATVSYLRLKRKVTASIDVGSGVYICDYIDTPFILGILAPRIYLPSSVEPDSASHVLAHERAHIARRDHWWKPLGYLLLSIHWFNPFMWLAYILLCRDIELACDEKVVKQMALPERKSYSDALLKCSVKRMHVAACPLAFGEVGVKERVKTVLNYKKPAFWIVLVAIIALIVTAVCFLTDPKADEPEIMGESPYSWINTVEVWDIRKAWAHPYEQSTYANTIEGTMLEEFITLLNGVNEKEIQANTPSGAEDPLWNHDGTSVHLYCSDGMSVWIRYADGTAIIGTDTESDIWETDGYWSIENEALKSWLLNLANGGTYMLSDENRDEIRRLVRQENVQFFNPQEYAGMLFVGCAYDNGRGLGVACYEPRGDGYKLLKLIRDEEVKPCASGGELYYCDYNQYRIFLVMNDSVTAMEWAGAYENTVAINTHPGLAVEYCPRNLGSMYRFIYSGGSTTMYMDWDNQTYGQVPDDATETFANPDDAYSVCSQLRLEQIEFASVTELVEVDERLNQAFAYYPNSDELLELLNLLQAIPEDAYEQAEYPEKDFRTLDIQFRNYSGVAQASPCLTLRLHESAVYYQFRYEWMKPYQTWKINSPEMVQYLESFFGGDMSGWEQFAPVPKIDGIIDCAFDGVEIITYQMGAFEYQVSEKGIRFKPEGQEGYVLMYYSPEPLAGCGTGLELKKWESDNQHSCVTGYYDGSEYWSFRDLTVTSGDTAIHVHFINENNAAWVKEFSEEISWMMMFLDFQVID